MSNFFHYFSYNFEKLGLKKLITTCYKSQDADLFSQNDSEQAIYLEYEGDKNGNNVPDPEEIGIKPLKGDGDFRSAESIELLKQADIVVTNPPFSLFREYVAQLIEYDKKFLIIGNQNAITYKEIFPLIKENKLWLGYVQAATWLSVCRTTTVTTQTSVDEDGQKWRSFGNMCWFTNLDISKRHEDLILYKTYNPGRLPDLRQLRRHRGRSGRGHPDGLRRASWVCRSPSSTSTTPTSSRSSGIHRGLETQAGRHRWQKHRNMRGSVNPRHRRQDLHMDGDGRLPVKLYDGAS